MSLPAWIDNQKTGQARVFPERGGRAAYAAYRGGNEALPTWAQLNGAQRAAWVEVARQAFYGFTGA